MPDIGTRSPRWHWLSGFLSGVWFGAACIGWGREPWWLVLSAFIVSAVMAALWVAEGLLRYAIDVLQAKINASTAETGAP